LCFGSRQGKALHSVQTCSGDHPAGTGVRRLQRETEHPLPCSARVKNTWNPTATSPHVLTMWCLIKHKHDFAFCTLYEILGAVAL
jgi:hypothetical protein